jgi:hypothetical protein
MNNDALGLASSLQEQSSLITLDTCSSYSPVEKLGSEICTMVCIQSFDFNSSLPGIHALMLASPS